MPPPLVHSRPQTAPDSSPTPRPQSSPHPASRAHTQARTADLPTPPRRSTGSLSHGAQASRPPRDSHWLKKLTRQVRPNRPVETIAYFATGGTISAQGATEHTYQAGLLSGRDCLAGIKLPARTHVEVEDVASIDSKDISAAHLRDYRNAILERLQDQEQPAKAAVITHGSDTLSTTAFYLHATLPPELLAKKKIVLTASMKPANVANPDGPQNLSDAFALARSSKGHGVMATLGGKIYAPPGFDKKHTTSVNAFQTVNADLVGTVRNGKVSIHQEPAPPPLSFNPGNASDLPVVTTIYSEPGVNPGITVGMIRAAVALEAEGIVYAGTGNGTMNEIVAEELKAQAAAGRLVIRSTKVGDGEVIRNGAFQDDEHGIAASGKLGPDMARLLAQLAIADARHTQPGTSVDMGEIRKVFDPYQSVGAPRQS
jgi:L-asparaginase